MDDALGTILRSVRLHSTILSRAELRAPWGVSTRGIPGSAVFHAVLEGSAGLRHGSEEVALEAGDVVVLPRGDAHELAHPPDVPAQPITSLPHVDVAGVPTLRHGRPSGSLTRILCGRFELDHVAAQAFLALLPTRLVASRKGGGAAPWTGRTLELIDAELAAPREGTGVVVTRLCDVLFIDLLRATADGAPRGWLAALADPQVGRALALIHDDPKTRWDATVLAERVGMSRTRFFARFSELVGEPPARYLARWRMNVAADVLRRGDLSTASVAELAGYASEDAFVRVFKRHVGKSPAEFRRGWLRSG